MAPHFDQVDSACRGAALSGRQGTIGVFAGRRRMLLSQLSAHACNGSATWTRRPLFAGCRRADRTGNLGRMTRGLVGVIPMRLKTWPVAAFGLGSLLLLIVVSMLASSRKAQDIYTQLDQLNTHHHNVDAKLRRLRSDVQSLGDFRPRLPAGHRARARTGVPPAPRRVPTDQHGDGRRAPCPGRRTRRSDSQPASEARRLLGDVRSALRLDADRKDLSERRLSAARGRAAGAKRC